MWKECFIYEWRVPSICKSSGDEHIIAVVETIETVEIAGKGEKKIGSVGFPQICLDTKKEL